MYAPAKDVIAPVEPDRTSSLRALHRATRTNRAPIGAPMLDLVMLAIGLGFFALSVGYAIACDRL
jgi:hypothetical protein